MLEESGKMIADSASRLGAAVQDLRDVVVSGLPSFELLARRLVFLSDASALPALRGA